MFLPRSFYISPFLIFVCFSGVFSLLKNQLDAPQFKQITDKIPGSEKLIESFVKSNGGGSSTKTGGLGGLMGMFGKKAPAPEGGDRGAAPGEVTNVTDLLGVLNKQGVSTSDATSFFPKLTDMVKTKSGVDVGSILGGFDTKKIEGLVPGVGNFMSKMPTK